MKVLVIDQYCALLSMCMKAIGEGHEVRWWLPDSGDGKPSSIGDGFVTKVRSFQPHVKWADIIITATNQKYMRDIQPLFVAGYPMFGCNMKAAELELDRSLGQTVCEDYGIETIPYEVFNSYSDAMKHVEKTMGDYVSKPWGGTADKSLSYVSDSPEDMIFKLTQWESEFGKLKGQIMLQEKVKGIEFAVGGWFGKGGWNSALCENFEEKKFMNDNLGQNTGEQGTTLRYVEKSKLFERTLEPITGYLHKIGYVGYVDQNCMVTKKGEAKPLELTMRFGYPLRDIQEPLHMGDSMEWKLNLILGKDTLKVKSDISLGIVMSHGKFPNDKGGDTCHDNVPLYGYTAGMRKDVAFVAMKMGQAPVRIAERIKWVSFPVSAGAEMCTITGLGESVQEAQERAYDIFWKLKPPTNKMGRTDLGKRLEKQLPELQSNGFAEGMKY